MPGSFYELPRSDMHKFHSVYSYELVLWPQIEDLETQFMGGQLLASDSSTLQKGEHQHGWVSIHLNHSTLLGWLFPIPCPPYPPPPSGSSSVLHDAALEILHSSHRNGERLMYMGWFWTCGLYVSSSMTYSLMHTTI